MAVLDYGQAGNDHTTYAVVDEGPTVQEAGPMSLFWSQEPVVAEEDESDTPDLVSDSDDDQESADGTPIESSGMPNLVASEDEEIESDAVESLDDIDEVDDSDDENYSDTGESKNYSPASSQRGSKAFVHGMPHREPVFCAEMLHSSPRYGNLLMKSLPHAKLSNPPHLGADRVTMGARGNVTTMGQGANPSTPLFGVPNTPSPEGASGQSEIPTSLSTTSQLTPVTIAGMTGMGHKLVSPVGSEQPSVYGGEVTN